MALATSGALTLDQIHVEAGGSTGATASLNDNDIRGLIAASGRTINTTQGTNIDFADFYGASITTAPDSFGKTGVTPGQNNSFGQSRIMYDNTQYTGGMFHGNDVNVEFNENSSFVDSNGHTQSIVSWSHNSGKISAATVVVVLLGHDAPTSSWTLSYSGISITGNSGFTYSGVSYGSPTVTNTTVNTSSPVNVTRFSFARTTATTTDDPFPSSSNQSWSIT